jgi:hypothetical protein
MSEQETISRPSGRHQISIGHLVMGIAFLGIVGVWALIQTDTVTGEDVRWLMPIPWVVAGVVGLAATAITGPRRHAVRQTGWAGAVPEQGWVGERSEQPERPDQPEEPFQSDQPEHPEGPELPDQPERPTAALPKYPEEKS